MLDSEVGTSDRELEAARLASALAQSEEAVARETTRAEAAEALLAAAERRAAQQSIALANLQALLDELQSREPDGDETEQLRLGGKLLAAELAVLDEAVGGWAEGRRAVAELSASHALLAAEQKQVAALREDVTRLHAALQASKTRQTQKEVIDKQLVTAFLTK